MEKLERVIYDLERCTCHVPDACRDCSKYGSETGLKCMENLMMDALELLKEQEDLDETPTIGGWISVKDRMPPNADHPGSFCPRYQVITKYGVTEGWYNPDKGCWYVLVWFLIGRYTEDDIDMERGDIPKISNNIEVTHWMMFPSAEGLDET